ncbi:hypothetical protein [Kangiella sp. M94]
MSKVNRSKDCGNSPKNKFAENIAISIELGDSAFLIEVLSQDALWELPNGSLIKRHEVKDQIDTCREKPVTLTIDHVVTHGKAGAVNGTVKIKSGALKRFCHVIEFSTAKCEKVRRLVSYGNSQ